MRAHRIAGGRRGRTYRKDAHLRPGAGVDAGSKARGKQLRAEADTPIRLPSTHCVSDESRSGANHANRVSSQAPIGPPMAEDVDPHSARLGDETNYITTQRRAGQSFCEMCSDCLRG